MNVYNELYKKDLLPAAQASVPWDMLEEKCVLITGAAGMIGSYLADVLMERNNLFRQRIKVLCLCRNVHKARLRFEEHLSNPLFGIVVQDVCSPVERGTKADFVIHAASNANPLLYSADPVGTMQANLSGTLNMLEYSGTNDVRRLLYVSSGEIYGENKGDAESFKEDYCGYIDCMNPRSCYPESKRAAETLCASYTAQYGLDTVIARLCHVYGPTMTQSDNRVTAQFIRNVLNNEDIVLKSAGLQLRSVCYVSDAVTAILYALLLGQKGQAYNVANKDSTISIFTIARTISKLFGLNILYNKPEDAEKRGYSNVNRAVLDAAKLEKLGWNAAVSLEEGLTRTVRILRGY